MGMPFAKTLTTTFVGYVEFIVHRLHRDSWVLGVVV